MDKMDLAVLTTDDGFAIGFRFKKLEDTFTRVIAETATPTSDGVCTKDHGGDKSTITVSAIFYDTIDTRYDDIYDLIYKYKSYSGLWNLEHPAYGSLSGRITQLKIEYKKASRYCEARIDFMETVDKSQLEIKALNSLRMAGTVPQNFFDTLATKMASWINAADTPLAWVTDIENSISRLQTLSMLLSSPMKKIASGVDRLANVPSKFIGAVVELIEAHVAATETIASTPEMISSIAFNMNQVVADINTIINTPDTLQRKFNYAMTAIYAVLSGVYVSQRLQDDADRRDILVAAEEIDSYTADGEYLYPQPFDGATSSTTIEGANSLEMIYLTQAELVNQAITLARLHDDDDETLRILTEQANRLRKFVQSMIMRGGYIKTIDLPLEMPLMVLLHDQGLPHKACERVHSLNERIINPTFYSSTVKIYES